MSSRAHVREPGHELGLRYGAYHPCSPPFVVLSSIVLRALGRWELAYAFVFFLGNRTLLMLAGLLGELRFAWKEWKRGLIVMRRIVARSCHIVSLYTHMQCWALLVRAFLLCCPADQGAGVGCEA